MQCKKFPWDEWKNNICDEKQHFVLFEICLELQCLVNYLFDFSELSTFITFINYVIKLVYLLNLKYIIWSSGSENQDW